MIHRFARPLGPVIVLLLAASFSRLASAATPAELRARELFEQGRALVEKGDCAGAIPRFVEARAAYATPGSLYNLALCEEKVGRLLAARAHWAALLGELRPGDARLMEAKAHVDALERRLPTVSFVLPAGAPAGTSVVMDGTPLPPDRLGMERSVDPGLHTVLVLAPGRERWTTRVTVPERARGTVLRLELGAAVAAPAPEGAAPSALPPGAAASAPPQPGAPAPAPPIIVAPAAPPPGAAAAAPSAPGLVAPAPPPAVTPDARAATKPAAEASLLAGPRAGADAAPGERTVLAKAAGIAGLGGFALCGVSVAMLFAQQSTVDAECGSDKRCARDGVDAADSVPVWSALGSVGFGVGAAGVAAYFLLPREAAGSVAVEPVVGPEVAGMSVRGSW